MLAFILQHFLRQAAALALILLFFFVDRPYPFVGFFSATLSR